MTRRRVAAAWLATAAVALSGVTTGGAASAGAAAVAAAAAPPSAAAPDTVPDFQPTGLVKGRAPGRPSPDRLLSSLSKVAVGVQYAAGNRGVASSLVAEAKGKGGALRHDLQRYRAVTVDVPRRAADAFIAGAEKRAGIERVWRVPSRSFSHTPNDTLYPQTTFYLNDVQAGTAWDVTQGSADARIAVLDSGVDTTHPDLVNQVQLTYNAVDATSNVTDEIGHGTMVAGVAAAEGDNNAGIAGVAMDSDLLAVKVANPIGEIHADSVANGITWAADNGADVINMSFGAIDPDPVEQAAVDYAVSQGVVVVAAAGNMATSGTNYPAAYGNVIAVGATDGAGAVARFTTRGSWVDVAAPGVEVVTTTAAGPGTAAGYAAVSGTSFSSPIVAGEAALLRARRGDLTVAQVRDAIVKSASAMANAGLGAGEVRMRAALDRLAPLTVPTLTEPAAGDVSGVVSLKASSTAPKVRFSVDGTPVGVPVSVSGGVATLPWETWGLANGARTVTAVDCSAAGACHTESAAGVTVNVANGAPTLTAPTAAAALSGSHTFTAEAAGGGVAFLVDGVRRGFDGSAPYAATVSLTAAGDGGHTATAVSCNVAGTVCEGPASAETAFTSTSLKPAITKASPLVLSPNGDGTSDSTTVTYTLETSQVVGWQVRTAGGTIVRGPVALGTKAAGTWTFVWNGLDDSAAKVASGLYTVELITQTGSPAVYGYASKVVRVDLTAPSITGVQGSGTTFFPYVDGYQDTFTPKFTINESATVTLTIRNSNNTVIRSISASRPAGATSMTWNGKTTGGSVVAAGWYSWTITARDGVGNKRTSSKYSVYASSKKLLTKSSTLTKRGYQYYAAGGTAGCAYASRNTSDFKPYGVRLYNGCFNDPYAQIAFAGYRFTLPAAYSYSTIKVQSYGNTNNPPSTLIAALFKPDQGTFVEKSTDVFATNAWRTVGTLSAAGTVDLNREIDLTLAVPNDYSDSYSDYDASYVRVVVTYKALG